MTSASASRDDPATAGAAARGAGVALPGLDGSVSVAFLAAIGLLRVVSDSSTCTGVVRMHWEAAGGTWIPRITGCGDDADALLDHLVAALIEDAAEHPALVVLSLRDADPVSCQREVVSALADPRKQAVDMHGWLGGLLVDFPPPDEGATSQLQLVRRDYFENNLRSIIKATTREHLARTLFAAWDYGDPLDNQSLHFDPSEDRRHAYQWNQPSGDSDRKRSGSMLGANRLALEALPVFVTLREGERLRTIGFRGTNSSNTYWRWPIWTVPVPLQVVGSLLASAALQPDRDGKTRDSAAQGLAARGVAAVFEVSRILVGKTPNLTPTNRV